MTHLGVVATGHAASTGAAARVLRAGGNAFDAIVAVGCASAVAEPSLTSLGGGGFLLARQAQGRATLFDFFVDTPGRGLPASGLEPHFLPVTVRFPASEQVFNVGLGSVAVPGNVRGFLHVHRCLGRLPLAEVVAPAVELAREGVVLNERQAYFLGLLEPIMTLTEPGRALYRPGDRRVAEGDTVRYPELADFLEALPGDAEAELYEGAIARAVARDMRDGGGLLTEADLAAFRVIERRPLRALYRDGELLTNPPPSFGGALIALSLRLLAARETARTRFGSAEHLAWLAAVQREVDRHRAEAIAGRLEPSAVGASLERVRVASGGTTHASVADADGNVASMTTSNGEGSGYFAPGSGVLLNNMLGEDDLHPDGFHASPPGERVASMMSPSLLLRDGRVALALGSGGSKRIRTALLQVLSAVVDFGRGLEQAVLAPRIHWDGEQLQVEPGFDAATLDALRARLPLNEWPVLDVYFGGVNAVTPDGDAAADPRRGGSVAVVESGR